MEKLKLHSPDLIADNINKIAAIFPGCVTESNDAGGQLTRIIDFDQLKQELSNGIVEGPQERYRLDWPGKREALLAANAPIAKTLRPCREESVDFDSTKNLFIEGDNLDALKLLQETYLGKVKLIYIDPPYNTGKEFLYDDDFGENSESYFQRSNQKDDTGVRLVANTEANGRFHSDWLSMIYPRLKLARSLLREDGALFISIDDNEVANLRKLCEEVFGNQNRLGEISILSNPRGRQSEKIATCHETLMVYAKNIVSVSISGDALTKEELAEYKYADSNGQKYRLLGLRHRGNESFREDRPNMYYPFFVNPRDGAVSLEKSDKFSIEVTPKKSTGEDGRWEWGKSTAKDRLSLLEGQRIGNEERWDIFHRDFLKDEDGAIHQKKWKSVWSESAINYQNGKSELKRIFDNLALLDYPKPLYLLKKIISGSTGDDSLILDFFSGSATTADAVMALNAETGSARRHIMVQLPEACDPESKAYQAGFKTIAEIGKERIRRAGNVILGEWKSKCVAAANHQSNLLDIPDLALRPAAKAPDIGFRVLKIDTSNLKEVYYRPDSIKQADLLAQADNIREDRTPMDLLFQVLVDWGIDLALPISKENIAGKTVFFVDKNALAACFEPDISEELVTALAKRREHGLPLLKVVFRDASYRTDSVKINVEQIFKLLSPMTDIRTL